MADEQYINSQETAEYIELRNVNAGPVQNLEIITELRNLNNRITVLEQNQSKLLENLTREVITLRNEVRQLKLVPEVIPTNLLPPLPITDIDSFKLLNENLKNDEMYKQLQYVLGKVTAVDPASFLRGAVKKVMRDEIAVQYTWRRTSEKESIQQYIVVSIMRNLCHSKFAHCDDTIINRTLQQHFVHAKDRIERRLTKQNQTK